MAGLEERSELLFEEIMRLSVRAERFKEEVVEQGFLIQEHGEGLENMEESLHEAEASFHSEFSGGVLGSPIAKVSSLRKEFMLEV